MINNNTFVAILTFNEQSNIIDCIRSINNCNFNEIAIFDGGSIDNTISLVKEIGIRFEIHEGSSISERRALALNYAINNNFEYVLFVDADQRLLDINTGKKAEEIFKQEKLLAGVQLNLIIPNDQNNFNYWQLGFYSRHRLITSNFGLKKVIGTPCFFKISIVKDFKYNVGNILGPSDDTFFCKEISNAGFLLKSINVNCTEIVRASLKSTLKKAYWYGIGDAEYVINETNSKNKRNHLFHVFVRNPIINPLKNINKFIGFYFIFGIARVAGFIYYFTLRPKKYLTKS